MVELWSASIQKPKIIDVSLHRIESATTKENPPQNVLIIIK
jgi:hypothetical protein